MAVKPIPDGYQAVIPYLALEGAAEVIEFAKRVFGAEVTERMDAPDGKIGHAEIRIGGAVVMLSEARGEWKPMPGQMYVYLDNVDEVYRRAIEAGATSLREPTNEFYGDRACGFRDLAGNHWWVATHVEDLSPEELQRRMREAGR